MMLYTKGLKSYWKKYLSILHFNILLFLPPPPITEKIKQILNSLCTEQNKMSILRLKNHMKRNLILLNCQSTENFLTAPLIYCNFQFPNTKIQQFLLKSIRWQFQYTKKPNKLFTKLYSLRKNFVQKIYKSFVPSITFKLSGLKIFTTMNLSKYIPTEPQTSRKFHQR